MKDTLSYLILFVFLWAVLNLADERPKFAKIIEITFKYVFFFLWPIVFLFSGYVYAKQGEIAGATILASLGLALIIPCTVAASSDPREKLKRIKRFFVGN